MAHHQITFRKNEDGTYYASCSCGPTFERAPSRDEALKYMEAHVGNLGVAFGVNTVGWTMQEPPETTVSQSGPEQGAIPPPPPPAPPEEVKETLPETVKESLSDA